MYLGSLHLLFLALVYLTLPEGSYCRRFGFRFGLPRVRVSVPSYGGSYHSSERAAYDEPPPRPGFNFSGYVHVTDPKWMISYFDAQEANLSVSGYDVYLQRYEGSVDYNEDPRVCYSRHSTDLENGTSLFVCPFHPSDADNDIYCCGDEDYQHCCNFWQGSGRVTVVAVGLCFVVGTVILISLCLIIKPRSRPQTTKEKDPMTTQRINFDFSQHNKSRMNQLAYD